VTAIELAWSIVSHDRLRFSVTITGIAFAVFLMTFQSSLLAGFTRAASRIVDATDADIWITARGVPCVDFPVPLPLRFRDLALGVDGVASVSHLVTGFGSWQKPSGSRQTVIVIGAEPGAGTSFPIPLTPGSRRVTEYNSVLIDRSNAETLGVTSPPGDIEISRRRAIVRGFVEGFASFVGSPYVFSGFTDGSRYLGLESEETVFLLVHVHAGSAVREVQRALQRRLPEADVWTKEEFSRRSQQYWLTQTGAGGSILLAAFLGFLVGLVIVSQSIYATTMENIEEFATLKAMGASRGYVQRVVLVQALASGLAGCVFGIAAAFPLMEIARGAIAWIFTPWWMPALVVVAGLIMCALASLISIHRAVSVEPGRVFRA
jgi:putative ABC transport system permease protein